MCPKCICLVGKIIDDALEEMNRISKSVKNGRLSDDTVTVTDFSEYRENASNE